MQRLEYPVGGRAPAAGVGAVEEVVVDERRRVEELDSHPRVHEGLVGAGLGLGYGELGARGNKLRACALAAAREGLELVDEGGEVGAERDEVGSMLGEDLRQGAVDTVDDGQAFSHCRILFRGRTRRMSVHSSGWWAPAQEQRGNHGTLRARAAVA